ncbi:DUF4126 domain-containing protein [Propionivibrio sp.]|jgi:hypothetical protein|uniref:DUF4126 domain-containing protein n=1 Tax=Propionivibrio sp. TaxID=2212460 RepID=UPI00272E9E1E|nr:DUF4126 domain-containing protein [Propionivibrio sp.]
MDVLQPVALAGGMAWASGMRLYAVLFLAGVLARLGYLDLPASLSILENPWIIGLSGLLCVIEFLADKIAIVDSLWDGIQGFIRIPAGALLAALALGGHDPAWMVAAGLLGGAVTAGTHLAKAGSRAMINTSPEPFSNIAASLGEDALAVSGLWAAIFYPALFLILLGLFLLLLIWLLPKLGGGVLAVFGGLFGWTKKQ